MLIFSLRLKPRYHFHNIKCNTVSIIDKTFVTGPSDEALVKKKNENFQIKILLLLHLFVAICKYRIYQNSRKLFTWISLDVNNLSKTFSTSIVIFVRNLYSPFYII